MEAGEWIALGGVGVAVLAVTAALLQEDLRRWLRPPEVSVSASVTVFNVLSRTQGRYVPHGFVRLKISVASGRGSATGVQVSLLSCTPAPRLGGIAAVSGEDMLLPLRWSFEHLAVVDLPAGASRYVDLLEVPGDHCEEARLTTTIAPDEGQLLAPSATEYQIQVLLSGHNIKPSTKTVCLKHSGSWDGTEADLHSKLTANVTR